MDLAKAREHGVKPGDVRRAATTLLSGIHVGSLFDQQKVFDVQVWSAPEVRENVSDVSNLVLDTPGGKHIKLSDVATVSVAPSPTSISHDGVSRRVDVTADVSGRSLNAVLDDVKGALKNVSFPMEYHAEVLGDYVEQKNAERGAMVLGAFALLVVFLLLQSAFESWRLAAVTLLTLPLCLLGGLVAARLTGAELTLATVAGLLAILALAVRASLRLVTRARELARHTSTSDAYAEASAEHAMPVVVTAAVAAAALLPVLVLGPRAGLESLQPFTVVVLGGLVTTVITVMLVLPALCGRYATRANIEAASAPPPPTSRRWVVAEFSKRVKEDIMSMHIGRRTAALTVALVLGSGALAGCSEPVAEAAAGSTAAKVEEIDGQPSRITLQGKAAQRLGLATQPVWPGVAPPD